MEKKSKSGAKSKAVAVKKPVKSVETKKAAPAKKAAAAQPVSKGRVPEKPKPAPKVKPVEKPKVAAKVKPVEKPKAVSKSKPLETVKPVSKAKPVVKEAPPKPAVKAKPAPKPAVKPAEKAKEPPAPKPETEAKASGIKIVFKGDAPGANYTLKQGTPLPAQFLLDLAAAIKDAVAPLARAVKGREIVDTAQSGDVTFQLDKVAEKTLLNFLKRAGLPVAYYSEDSGYSTFTSEKPRHLLIVDPIDGSRAAKSGFEGCVVSVASTRVIERPTIGGLDNACVVELLGERTFYAERGKGVRIHVGEQLKKAKLSANTSLDMLTWSMTVPARPAELIFPTAARLIDFSSMKGGFFSCNSTAYSLTRLLTNQLDACVDFANRFYRDIPDRVREMFQRAGGGKVIGIAPYDIAAALLIAEEAGCVVTDAKGGKFDEVLLLDSSESNHLSLVAASNKELHTKLLDLLDRRIIQMEALLNRTI